MEDPLKILMDFEIDPANLDIAEMIGTGSTANIYKAVYRSSSKLQQVAVKRIDVSRVPTEKTEKGDSEEEDRLLAFRREIAIMTRICHPHFVSFIGLISLSVPISLVMEFCPGGCVFDLLHERLDVDVSWKQKHKILLDTAEAMNYLHSFEPEIVHRDLKSLNLLLTETFRCSVLPHIKLSDFGLSRMRENGSDWGIMTNACGTTHWMAPEVVLGTNYDQKCDVYSFAMIIYEVICREMPFEDVEAEAVGTLASQGHRPTPDAIPPDCPDYLTNLMVACWAHQPQSRPSFTVVLELLSSVPAPLLLE